MKYLTRYTGRRRGEPLCSPVHTGQAQGPAPTICTENGELSFWKIPKPNPTQTILDILNFPSP